MAVCRVQLQLFRFVMSSDTPSSDRARRLATNRERATSRRASESAEVRERRLARVRARRRERLATETAEERETPISRGRLCQAARQRERLTTETAEERETRLSRGRLCRAARQRERLATETAEERETRIGDPAPPASAQPLLHQPAVQARMRKFHSQLASLEVSTCTTCLERFPGMTTRQTAAGTVCIRCHRDTHSPKAYSWENNMHPGPVPMELVVSVDSGIVQSFHSDCFVSPNSISYLLICRG